MKPQESHGMAKYLHWNALWIGLFLLAIALFLFGSPFSIDDFLFQIPLKPWFDSQGIRIPYGNGDIAVYGYPLPLIMEVIREHAATDNSRLCNIIVSFILPFPKWVGMLPPFLAWCYAVTGSIRLSGTDWRRSHLIPVAIFFWTFFMTWRGGMTSVVYAFNYVVSAGLCILLLRLLFSGGRGRGRMLGILVLSTAIGWWQEAFSIPMIAGIAALTALRKDCRNRYFYASLVGLSIGLVGIVGTPSFSYRFLHQATSPLYDLSRKLACALLWDVPYWIFTVLLLYVMSKGYWKKVRNKSLTVLLAISGFIPICMMMVTYCDCRITTWTQIASVAGILCIVNDVWPDYWQRLTPVTATVSTVCLVSSFLHLAVADYYALKMRASITAAVEHFQRNPSETHFGEVHTNDRLPLIALTMPGSFAYGSTIALIDRYVSQAQYSFAIIPQELRNITERSGVPLDGDSGARLIDGRIVIPSKYDGPVTHNSYTGSCHFLADYGDGYRAIRVSISTFKSESDGKRYYYVCPYDSWIDKHFRQIKGLRYAR